MFHIYIDNYNEKVNIDYSFIFTQPELISIIEDILNDTPLIKYSNKQ